MGSLYPLNPPLVTRPATEIINVFFICFVQDQAQQTNKKKINLTFTPWAAHDAPLLPIKFLWEDCIIKDHSSHLIANPYMGKRGDRAPNSKVHSKPTCASWDVVRIKNQFAPPLLIVLKPGLLPSWICLSGDCRVPKSAKTWSHAAKDFGKTICMPACS